MINFAQAYYLFLILLIPILFLVFALMRRSRKKRVARFGEPALVNQLTPYASKRKGWVKLTLLSLALFFFAIGMARPQLGATLKEQEVKGVEIMIALDVSNSMLAEDYSPNRLDRAKLAISKLVDRLKDDRVGLIVFAGQAFVQLPITTDYVSAKIFLNSINTESVPVQGTAMGDAIYTSIKSFSPGSENSRAIILITDGENHEDDPVTAAKDAATAGIRVFCVGVGSSEGKPIPMNGELLKDNEGNIVVTRLDDGTLKSVADAGNGIYVRAGNSEFGLNPIIDDIKNMDAKQYQSVVFEDFDEQYMYFFGIALFFLLLELLVTDRRNGRKLFKDKVGVLVLLFMLSSLTTFAQEDRSEVRSGNRAFKKGDYQKSEIDYKRALIKDSTSVTANYNLGNTMYKMENWTEAEKFYKGLGDTLKKLSPEKASQYFHNSGDAALQQKKYQEAVDAFKESLRLNPSDMDTKSNLAYAQKKLQDQQQQQQNQDQNQDQNKDQQQNQDQQNQNKDQQNQDQKKDQNQDQNQDQNKDQQNQDQQDQNQDQQQTPSKITPQAAQQMLQAMEDKEKETQDKVKKEKALKLKSRQKEKNW